jgi:hypothetical protein
MDPSSWRGWGGTDFNITFVSPYTMPHGTEEDHVCVPAKNLLDGDCFPAGLVWSEYLERFVVSLGCSNSKILYSTSEDLIHWDPAVELYDPRPMKEVVSLTYPAFIDPTAPTAFNDSNYHTIGQNPWLFWVSLGHSPYTDGRHLWATPMKFTRS